MNFELILSFVIMLNPFALFLYLKGVMDELSDVDFYKVLFKASLISYFIYVVFAIFGESVFINFFKINFESFRIFGGVVIFAYAFVFIMKGSKTWITMKESLEDLSSEIALPFMVGAGTISLSVIIGFRNSVPMIMLKILIVLAINYVIIALLKMAKDFLDKKMMKKTFDKYSNILVRINGFIVGAIGVDMIAKGITAIYQGIK